jgi:hypothetical protein
MKNRFPIEIRAGWRQRFLAIAREMQDAGSHRRESLDAPPAVRARFLAPRSLRGVRLGCARAG